MMNNISWRGSVMTPPCSFSTPDVDGHSGGALKAAGYVKDLGSKSTRWGTYDTNPNSIGG